MKKLFLAVVIINMTAVSCKKNAASKNCELTTSAFAGQYKITKQEYVAYLSGVITDQTSLLSDCTLAAVYDFKPDGTATYTESGGCSGNSTGSWNISDSLFSAGFSSGNGGKIGGTHIESWNCNRMVVITRYPAVDGNNRYTLTRQ